LAHEDNSMKAVATGLYPAGLVPPATLSACCLVVSYVIILPGAFGEHLIYDSGHGFSLRTGPYNLVKTLSSTGSSWECHVLASFCAWWAFALPIVKLLVYTIVRRCMQRENSRKVLLASQQLCKWCMIDAVLPMGFAGILASEPKFSPSRMHGKHIRIQPGLYCFVLHLVFCSFAFLLLVDDTKSEAERLLQHGFHPAPPRQLERPRPAYLTREAVYILLLLCNGGLVYFLTCIPLCNVRIDMAGIDVTVTAVAIAGNIFFIGDILIAQIFGLVTIIVPMVDVTVEILALGGHKINSTLKLWVQHFCMIELMFMSIFCSEIILPAIFPVMVVTLAPACKAGGAVSCAWWLYGATLRNKLPHRVSN